ncbi:MAG: hypothetical protein ACI4S9_08790 [Christensenellales bacterium]
MATIEIHSAVPGRIYTNGKRRTDGESFETNRDEVLDISFFPYYEKELFAAISLKIAIRDNRLLSLNPGARAVVFGENVFLTLVPPEISVPRPTRIISQITQGNCLSTLYSDGKLRLMCEGGSFFTHTLPDLTDCKLTSGNCSTGVVTALRGKSDKGSYLLAVLTESGNVLYEINAAEIDIREDCVIATDYPKDMARHRIRTVYRPDVPPTRTAEATGFTAVTPELLPYFFLEAVAAGSENEAMEFLGLDTDYESVTQFLGEFDTVAPLPGKYFDKTLVAVYDSSQSLCVPSVLSFRIEGNKIANIDKRENFFH